MSSLLLFLKHGILRFGGTPVAHATAAPPTSIPNPLIYGSVPELLDHLLNVLLVVSGAVVVTMIVYAGLLYITSLGDPKRRQNATNTLKYAVIGFAIIASARMIVSVVSSLIP